MRTSSIVLPAFLVFVLLGAGCASTQTDVTTQEFSDQATPSASTRKSYDREQTSNDELDENEDETIQEEEDELQEEAKETDTESTAELEDLAEDVDDLLGGMDAGESGF